MLSILQGRAGVNRANPKVDEFLRKTKKWRAELETLRRIVLRSGLSEELKWHQPCYTLNKSNVLILGGLKNYCVLSFFKGALLKDPHQILSKPGENTQSARIVRFTSIAEIDDLEPLLNAYIKEAIAVESARAKVDFKRISAFKLPDELEVHFQTFPALKTAFQALTPGRQRGYLLHFSAPKQSKTRASRVEKCVPRILSGKGLID